MSSIRSSLSVRKLWGLARFLYVQRVKGFDPPGPPLLDEETSAWLTERLKSTNRYLEFGSGGSTVLANRLGVPSVTVESDRFYAAVVRKVLPLPENARIVTPAMGLTGPWGMPIVGKAEKGQRYVFAPFDQLENGFPDFIFVDGRYRVACVLESARRAFQAHCTTTVLLDDYADRPYYHVLESLVGEPQRIGRAAIFSIGDRAVDVTKVGAYLSDAR